MKAGTIVDATIIQAPGLTKNESKGRDSEMEVGTDVKGLVHDLTVTDAAEADVNQFAAVLSAPVPAR